MFRFVIIAGQTRNIVLDIHGQIIKIHFLAQPVRVQAGIVDIIVDFLLDHIGAGKPLSPSGSVQGNAMTGAITDQYPAATGYVGIIRASKNISRLPINNGEPVQRFTAIVKNYKCFHTIDV